MKTSADDQSSNKINLNKYKGQSILSEEFEELAGIIYRPKTQETRQSYEIVLSFIQDYIGDQPRDVLCGAADEVLIMLKNDRMRDKERKREIDSLLGCAMNDERFAQLVNLGKKLTDWSNDELEKLNSDNINDENNMDETVGVRVMIGDEEDDEDDDNDVYEINEDQEGEEDDEDGTEATESQVIQGNVCTLHIEKQFLKIMTFLNKILRLQDLRGLCGERSGQAEGPASARNRRLLAAA
jgi:pre-mRNA-splicing helicase BRR2